jgi:hypothetical protein
MFQPKELYKVSIHRPFHCEHLIVAYLVNLEIGSETNELFQSKRTVQGSQYTGRSIVNILRLMQLVKIAISYGSQSMKRGLLTV